MSLQRDHEPLEGFKVCWRKSFRTHTQHPDQSNSLLLQLYTRHLIHSSWSSPALLTANWEYFLHSRRRNHHSHHITSVWSVLQLLTHSGLNVFPHVRESGCNMKCSCVFMQVLCRTTHSLCPQTTPSSPLPPTTKHLSLFGCAASSSDDWSKKSDILIEILTCMGLHNTNTYTCIVHHYVLI